MDIKSPQQIGGEVIHRAREAALDFISEAIARGVDKSQLMQITADIRSENQANFDRVNDNLNGGFVINVGRLAIIAKPSYSAEIPPNGNSGDIAQLPGPTQP